MSTRTESELPQYCECSHVLAQADTELSLAFFRAQSGPLVAVCSGSIAHGPMWRPARTYAHTHRCAHERANNRPRRKSGPARAPRRAARGVANARSGDRRFPQRKQSGQASAAGRAAAAPQHGRGGPGPGSIEYIAVGMDAIPCFVSVLARGEGDCMACGVFAGPYRKFRDVNNCLACAPWGGKRTVSLSSSQRTGFGTFGSSHQNTSMAHVRAYRTCKYSAMGSILYVPWKSSMLLGLRSAIARDKKAWFGKGLRTADNINEIGVR
jgi:hypothetical protein